MYQFCQINENPEMLSASEDAGDDELALKLKGQCLGGSQIM